MKTIQKTFFIFCFSILVFPVYAAIPFGNGTWAYDSLYADDGSKTSLSKGLFAEKIAEYNKQATPNHKITQIFSYGSDLEMACKGTQDTNANTPCNTSNMWIYYQPDGQETTATYLAQYKKFNSSDPIIIVPIIDGRLDLQGEDDLLSPLNSLNQQTAEDYADIVATAVCKDSKVAGIQFDIEPFDINRPGQAYFYQQIAKDFAGKNNNVPGCVDADHPEGRFFSIFTFADSVNEKVAGILNQYKNGYIVDSLYDLGPLPGGSVNSPEKYRAYVDVEIKKMLTLANQYNVKFQLAIPAAASVHEFEEKMGVATGYSQLAYVQAIFDAIDANHVRENSNFLGIAIWSWNDKMFWHGEEYKPASPNLEMQTYLGKKL